MRTRQPGYDTFGPQYPPEWDEPQCEMVFEKNAENDMHWWCDNCEAQFTWGQIEAEKHCPFCGARIMKKEPGCFDE